MAWPILGFRIGLNTPRFLHGLFVTTQAFAKGAILDVNYIDKIGFAYSSIRWIIGLE